jgi:diguanylate cyclase (GGDEF)-like protein/PAS domain S-box-containing protein
MPRSLRNFKVFIALAAVTSLLIVVLLTAALLIHDRSEALHNAGEQVARVASSSETEINRTLLGVDVMLSGLGDWAAQAQSTSLKPHSTELTWFEDRNLQRLVSAALNQNLLLRDIAIINANGKTLLSARPSTQRLGLPMPDGFFAAVLAQPFSELRISAPVINPLHSDRVLYLARSQRLADGSKLIAVAELQLALLTDQLNPGDDLHRFSVTLEKDTGLLLASFPLAEALMGQTLANALPQPTNTGQITQGNGRLNAQTSIMMVRPTLYAGNWLSVSMPQEAALAEWRTEVTVVLSVASTLLLLIIGAAWAIWRSFIHMALARAEVTHANARLQFVNQELASSLSLVEATLQATADGLLVVGNDQCIQQYNTAFAGAMGVPVDILKTGDLQQIEAMIRPQLLNPDDDMQFNTAAYADPQVELRDQWLFKDGRVFLRHSLPQMLNTQVMGRVWSFQDVTSFKQAERKLQLAASVFTHAHEGITITDAQGIIVDVNATFVQITGYSRDEVIGKKTSLLQSGRQSREFYSAMWQTLLELGHWHGEVWNRRKSGEVYAEMLSISAVRDDAGTTRHYVALFTDITSMKQHAQQLEHIAHFDVLTNLPNRVLLADRLQQGMAQTQRRNESLAVVYLDLDGFKAINDQYGHAVGDELLISLATGLKDALREGDTLARIGGDEFVAVLVDLAHAQDCQPVLARLLQAAAHATLIGEQILQVSASVGVTIYPQDDSDADLLLRHADQAMYVAKQGGKNRYHMFDLAQDAAVQAHSESLANIRRALDLYELVLFYQPKVNMQTGAVVGAEALIRWQHPQRGLLAPGQFLPIIEDHPMIVELGEWTIAAALSQVASWQTKGLRLPVSVNIGARQLQQSDFPQRLQELLQGQPDVPANWLELEILETSAMKDMTQASDAMRDCIALGVHFALDDFGTGYSSLTYLKRLPAGVLKIDQSFVRDMLLDRDDLAIVQGVIGLAATFGREVIAEGVETAAHGSMLLSLGCTLAQGYGIARPMPAADMPAWVQAWQASKNWP